MPKFSIKDLLIAITIVAAGSVIVVTSLRFWTNAHFRGNPIIFGYFSGCALIGAGIMYPFTRPVFWAVGAIVCGVVGGLIAIAIYLMELGY